MTPHTLIEPCGQPAPHPAHTHYVPDSDNRNVLRARRCLPTVLTPEASRFTFTMPKAGRYQVEGSVGTRPIRRPLREDLAAALGVPVDTRRDELISRVTALVQHASQPVQELRGCGQRSAHPAHRHHRMDGTVIQCPGRLPTMSDDDQRTTGKQAIASDTWTKLTGQAVEVLHTLGHTVTLLSRPSPIMRAKPYAVPMSQTPRDMPERLALLLGCAPYWDAITEAVKHLHKRVADLKTQVTHHEELLPQRRATAEQSVRQQIEIAKARSRLIDLADRLNPNFHAASSATLSLDELINWVSTGVAHEKDNTRALASGLAAAQDERNTLITVVRGISATLDQVACADEPRLSALDALLTESSVEGTWTQERLSELVELGKDCVYCYSAGTGAPGPRFGHDAVCSVGDTLAAIGGRE